MKRHSVKTFFVLLGILCLSQAGSAQFITASDKRKLAVREDSLQEYAFYMATDTTTEDRMVSDSIFTRILVRTLQVKNSFYYPFDSVKGVSRLYAPDSTFRIFTWNLQFDESYSRQKGAIQFRTKDGSLKLIRLRDVSEFTDAAEDSVRDRDHWIGAVYYKIIKTQYNGRNYYTLFGFDNYSALSSKKWVEVLYFNERNEPVFGGPFFSYEKDSPRQPARYRFSIEYKKEARTVVNYVDEMGMILVDHLISETDEPDNKWTYVPDGDSEGFRWENGKWVHVDKAFDFQLDMNGADPNMGRPPVGAPILDNKGKKNDKKLEEQSNKNKAKEPYRPSSD
ncbi:MAG: hypothetical protein ABW019_16890 [Chitinophagaceae bacterium]